MELCNVTVIIWYGHQICVPVVAWAKMLQCESFSSEGGNNTGMKLPIVLFLNQKPELLAQAQYQDGEVLSVSIHV